MSLGVWNCMHNVFVSCFMVISLHHTRGPHSIITRQRGSGAMAG